MRDAVLVFLLRRRSVALGRKLKYIVAGYRTSAGGKIEPGETPEQAAKRETSEEAGAETHLLLYRGVVEIENIDHSDWNCRLHLYICREFDGEPTNSDEIIDWQWYDIDNLPWGEIRPSDRTWLEAILVHDEIVALRCVVQNNQLVSCQILDGPLP